MFLTAKPIDPSHSKYFEMWRGVCALTVVISHTLQTFSPKHASLFSVLGSAAVMIFFVISGFFIHKSLARCYNGQLDWRSFLRARSRRILPPFAACLVLTIVLWFAAPYFFSSGSREFINTSERVGYSLAGLWQTTLFLNNFLGPTLSANGALWSLAFEFWYYVLACLFAMALTGQRIGWIAAPLLILLSVLNKGFAIFGLIWLGGFFVSVLHARSRLPTLPRIPMWLFPVSMIAPALLFPDSVAWRAGMALRITVGAWMVWHMMYILSRPKIRNLGVLVWLGSFSYSLYVFHCPILLFAYGISESSALPAVAIVILFCALVGVRLERWRFSSTPNLANT